MLHGSMNKFMPFFSEFQCNENNAMKPISSVAIGSTENPWKIKDNTRKGNRALQSPISATITERVWIIKITFTAQFRWEKQVSVSVHCWFVLPFLFSPAFFTFASHLIKMAQEPRMLSVWLPALRTRKDKLMICKLQSHRHDYLLRIKLLFRWGRGKAFLTVIW